MQHPIGQRAALRCANQTTTARKQRLARVAMAAMLVATCGAGAAHAAPSQWYFHTGGLTHHFEQTQASNREWRNEHPGIGIEHRSTNSDDGWSLRWGGGVMQDSRAFWGGYGGASYLYAWRIGSAAEVGLGAGAYGFYRSTSWSGQMKLVPAILPTASIGFADNRIGLNLIYVPRMKSEGDRAMASLVHAQMVFRFR